MAIGRVVGKEEICLTMTLFFQKKKQKALVRFAKIWEKTYCGCVLYQIEIEGWVRELALLTQGNCFCSNTNWKDQYMNSVKWILCYGFEKERNRLVRVLFVLNS
jgi:hypothetical protein